MNTETQAAALPADLIDATARDLDLSMAVEFIPFSQSRNKAEKSPTLNWRVTLIRNKHPILTTDYSAGCAHCPSYKQMDRTVRRAALVAWECENGRKAFMMESIDRITGTGKPLKPELRDILYSLASDSDVLDSGGFEDWAGNLGYDTDSRKAESVYRACLDIALKLRNALGEDGLARLRAACQDY